MTYCVAGIATELAPDPVWLGSFIQNTLRHFKYKLLHPMAKPAAIDELLAWLIK